MINLHYDKTEYTHWYDNILERDLPKRAFTNTLTGNFLLSVSRMFQECVKNVDSIKERFRI